MEKEVLISVIIPVYNVESYLDRCIESVVDQTYKMIEIILIDDGSQDNSGIICDKWKLLDQRVVVIHQENGGLSCARNVGMAHATGEYVFFLDSDDYLDLKTIEILYYQIIEYHVDIACTNLSCVPCTNSLKMYSSKDFFKWMFVVNGNGWEAQGKLIPKHLLEDFQFPDGKWYEDLNSIPKLLLNATTISWYDAGLYKYEVREDSIMGQSKKVIKPELVEAIEKNYMLARKHFNDCDFCLLEYSFFKFCYLKIKSIANNYKNNQQFIESVKAFVNKYYESLHKNPYLKERKKRFIQFVFLNSAPSLLCRIISLLQRIKRCLS